MIHSARPTVSPVANIVFALFCFARFWKVGLDRRHAQKQWSLPAVTVGRPSGSIFLNNVRKEYFLWFRYCFDSTILGEIQYFKDYY